MITTPDTQVMHANNILTLNQAARIVAELKAKGKSVGLCHGGFDVLHPGHILHFAAAKKLCDVLFVSITADRFVAERKGSKRPIFSEELRAYATAMVKPVDFVVIADFKSGIEIIETLKPTIYIKGPDYIGKQTDGINTEREAISRVGGQITYTTEPKMSSTDIIEYIKENG